MIKIAGLLLQTTLQQHLSSNWHFLAIRYTGHFLLIEAHCHIDQRTCKQPFAHKHTGLHRTMSAGGLSIDLTISLLNRELAKYKDELAAKYQGHLDSIEKEFRNLLSTDPSILTVIDPQLALSKLVGARAIDIPIPEVGLDSIKTILAQAGETISERGSPPHISHGLERRGFFLEYFDDDSDVRSSEEKFVPRRLGSPLTSLTYSDGSDGGYDHLSRDSFGKPPCYSSLTTSNHLVEGYGLSFGRTSAHSSPNGLRHIRYPSQASESASPDTAAGFANHVPDYQMSPTGSISEDLGADEFYDTPSEFSHSRSVDYLQSLRLEFSQKHNQGDDDESTKENRAPPRHPLGTVQPPYDEIAAGEKSHFVCVVCGAATSIVGVRNGKVNAGNAALMSVQTNMKNEDDDKNSWGELADILHKTSLGGRVEKSASSDRSHSPSHSEMEAEMTGWQQEAEKRDGRVKHEYGRLSENKRVARRKALRMTPYPPRGRRLPRSKGPSSTKRLAIEHFDDRDDRSGNTGSDGDESFTKVPGTIEAAMSPTLAKEHKIKRD